jgi:hypothetical protein
LYNPTLDLYWYTFPANLPHLLTLWIDCALSNPLGTVKVGLTCNHSLFSTTGVWTADLVPIDTEDEGDGDSSNDNMEKSRDGTEPESDSWFDGDEDAFEDVEPLCVSRPKAVVLIPRPFGVVDSIKGDLTFGFEASRRLPNDGTADCAGAVEGRVRPRGACFGVDPRTGDIGVGGVASGGDLKVNVELVAGDHCDGKVIGYVNDGAVSASVGMDRLCSEGAEEGI